MDDTCLVVKFHAHRVYDIVYISHGDRTVSVHQTKVGNCVKVSRGKGHFALRGIGGAYDLDFIVQEHFIAIARNFAMDGRSINGWLVRIKAV